MLILLRSEVGHVDRMMECLLQADQYLITAIDPAAPAHFTAALLLHGSGSASEQ